MCTKPTNRAQRCHYPDAPQRYDQNQSKKRYAAFSSLLTGTYITFFASPLCGVRSANGMWKLGVVLRAHAGHTNTRLARLCAKRYKEASTLAFFFTTELRFLKAKSPLAICSNNLPILLQCLPLELVSSGQEWQGPSSLCSSKPRAMTPSFSSVMTPFPTSG